MSTSNACKCLKNCITVIIIILLHYNLKCKTDYKSNMSIKINLVLKKH